MKLKKRAQTTKKLTTAELVEIGDRIHFSESHIILTDLEVEGEVHDSFVSARGKEKDLVMILYNALKGNPGLLKIVASAVVMVKLEEVRKEITEQLE